MSFERSGRTSEQLIAFTGCCNEKRHFAIFRPALCTIAVIERLQDEGGLEGMSKTGVHQ